MVAVTGYTKAHMDAISDSCVISGAVVLDNLHLTTRGGAVIDAGNVRGPQGIPGTDALVNTLFPIGFEMTWPGTLASIPGNYMHEDGRLLVKATYPVLYEKLGDNWNIGGELSTQFRLPNSINKVIVGAGGTYSLGHYGGENTHILSTSEMPQHNHAITDPGHAHDIPDHSVGVAAGEWPIFVLGGPDSFAGGAVPHGTGITTQNRGSGTAHNNMQEFGAKYVIIRAT